MMGGLLDIAPPEISAKEITVRGVKLRLQGIAARDWANLYGRFPDLARAVEGQKIDNPSASGQIGILAAVIAAGVGQCGDPKVERAAIANLTLAEASMVMQEAIALSLPGDVFGPLLDAARAPGGSGGAAA
jgi:hypothetical protein